MNALAQTSDGFVWVGTEAGLHRLDRPGNEQREEALGAEEVRALAAGRDGTLWVSTPTGVVRRSDGRWHPALEVPGGPGATALAVGMDGTLYAAAGDRVFALRPRGESFRALGAAGAAVRILLPDGRGGVTAFAKGRLARFDVLGSPPSTVDVDASRIVTVASNGSDRAWLLERDGNVRVINLSTQKLLHRLVPDTPSPEMRDLRELAIDADGTPWAVGPSGLVRWDEGAWRLALEPDHPLGRRGANCQPLVDREGGFWWANGPAVSRAHKRFIKHIGVPGSQEQIAFAVEQTKDGAIWFSSVNGLVKYDLGRVTPLRSDVDLPVHCLRSLSRRQSGGLWIASCVEGLAAYADGRTEVIDAPVPNLMLVTEARDGTVYAGSLQGALASYRDGRWNVIAPPDPNCPNPRRSDCATTVTSMAETANGSLWAATVAAGLVRIVDGRMTRIGTDQGLPSPRLLSLYVDANDDLWIGTRDAGLVRHAGGRFQLLDRRHGLPADGIHGIVEDSMGRLWLSGTNGVSRVDRSQLDAAFAGRAQRVDVISYDASDGLASPRTSERQLRSALRAHDGSLWFPTHSGVVGFASPDAFSWPSLPTPSLEASVDGGPFVQVRPGGAVPTSESGQVTIRFAVPYFTAPRRISITHSLEGHDQAWVNAEERREVRYEHLRRGSYVWKLAAYLVDDPRTRQEVTLVLRRRGLLDRPWTWPLLLVALAGAGFGWHSLRVRRQRDAFRLVLEERNRIARDLHDGLAQSFTAISFEVDRVAAKIERDPNVARTRLEHVQSLIKQVRLQARQTIWDLRLESSEREMPLPAALRQLCTQAGLAANVVIDVHIDETSKIAPSPAVRAEVLGIAREALTNALVHAGASRIDVSLAATLGRMTLRVQDDGKGFSPDAPAPAGHFGLQGMRERAARVRGEVTIHAGEGAGTTVSLDVPL